MKENYTAKLIIRGLPKMEELEMRDLIIWLEDKVKEFRDEYNKPLPSKTYNKIFTARLMKGSQTKNGSKILGIQVKCPDHSWQRTIHIKDGIGCSKCYGIKKL